MMGYLLCSLGIVVAVYVAVCIFSGAVCISMRKEYHKEKKMYFVLKNESDCEQLLLFLADDKSDNFCVVAVDCGLDADNSYRMNMLSTQMGFSFVKSKMLTDDLTEEENGSKRKPDRYH